MLLGAAGIVARAVGVVVLAVTGTVRIVGRTVVVPVGRAIGAVVVTGGAIGVVSSGTAG